MEKLAKHLSLGGEKISTDQYVFALHEYVSLNEYARLSKLPHCFLPETDEFHLQTVQESRVVLSGDPYQQWMENALFYASEMNHPLTIRYLLEIGTDPLCHFQAPFMFACRWCGVEIVKAFLEYSQLDDERHRNVVYTVIQNSLLSVLKLLIPLDHAWHVGVLPKSRVLDLIICNREIGMLEYIVDAFPLSQADYYSCVRMAVLVGYLDILQFLHAYEKSPPHENTINSLIHSAVTNNRWSILCYLMAVYNVRQEYCRGMLDRQILVEMLYEEFMGVLVNFTKGRMRPIESPWLAKDYLFDGNIGLILAQYLE